MSSRQPDPMSGAGRWLVTTASGARHLIDTRTPSGRATVTRLTANPDGTPAEGFRLGSLRRDGEPLELRAVMWLDGTTMRDGLVIGEDMYLVLEPLRSDADATLRRTTPVVSIERLAEERRDD